MNIRNRRVVITVTAPDGTVIGDGSLGSAIEDFITYARGQLGKIDGILAQQASVLAFERMFLFAGVAFLFVIPLALFLRKPQTARQAKMEDLH